VVVGPAGVKLLLIAALLYATVRAIAAAGSQRSRTRTRR